MSFLHSIRAWFDFTAGSVITPAMYEYLHLPVLTPGRGADDACSMPVPHVYTYYALIGGSIDLLYAFSKNVPLYVGLRFSSQHDHRLSHSEEVPFAMEMNNVLSSNGALASQVPDWQTKRPVAVYRGSCFPTANPDPAGPGYLFLRGAVCAKAAEVNAPYLGMVFNHATCSSQCTVATQHRRGHENRPRVCAGCPHPLLHRRLFRHPL